MTAQPRATKDDYDRAFSGLDFPTSKDAALRKARDHGGIDAEVDAMLEEVGASEFASYGDLLQAIHDVYLAQGVPEAEIPV
jgi:hypothetical protein